MKYLLPVLALMLSFFSCSNEDDAQQNATDLKGTWIETQTRLDTLCFETIDQSNFLNLKRGKEIRNGILLPKYKSGPYYYVLTESKISLNWVLSSNSRFKDYFFERTADSLKIGDFYESDLGDVLIFERLKQN